MQKNRVMVPLDRDTVKKLYKLSRAEHRDIRDQAAILIKRGLAGQTSALRFRVDVNDGGILIVPEVA